MRPLALIFENKFVPGANSAKKKKFERWKIVGSGLAIVAAGLLLATFIISGESSSSSETEYNEEEYSTRDEYNEYDSEIGFNVNVGTKSSEEDILLIYQNMLPMARIYCSIQNCVVVCSFIPAASNPGLVAAIISMSDYKTLCSDQTLIEELIFTECRFPNDRLSSKWFPSSYQLKKLTLRRCSLTMIDQAAFKTWQFQRLNSLSIIENRISLFEKSFFDNLVDLEELVVTNNVINVAEADLLIGTSKSLKIIQINNAIYSEDTLTNITGKSSLPNVILLSLSGNSIETISENVFKGVPNVQSLYLTNSGISSIGAGAFEPFSCSIRQLFLSDNKISSLPSEVFRSILNFNPNFKFTLGNNEWNCDCDLLWLQILINRTLNSSDKPRCSKPEKNNMLIFSEADFCDVRNDNETAPNSSIPVSITTKKIGEYDDDDYEGETTAVTDRNLVTLLCEEKIATEQTTGRKLLSILELNIKSRLPSFAVEESENGSTYVNINPTTSSYTLIWFCNSYKEPEFNIDTITCITNVRNSLYLNDFEPGVLYTICVLNMFLDLSSPFDCVSFEKKINHDDRLWLANEDKTIYISLSICVLIFVCATSVIVSCYVVRKNPRLLKGSKRVIMVRHRTADAIILPESIRLRDNNDDENQKELINSLSIKLDNPTHKDYVTPLSKRRILQARKSSIVSRISSNSSASSYVTGIEPTNLQLMSWRIGRIREILSCDNLNSNNEQIDHDNESPPPLPPPRNKSIPSLSLNIGEIFDSVNDKDIIFSTAQSSNVDNNYKTNYYS